MDEEIGVIHQYIDQFMDLETLSQYISRWVSIACDGISVRDALVGQVLGGVLRLYANLRGLEESELSGEEVDMVFSLVMKRLYGLGDLIDKALKME